MTHELDARELAVLEAAREGLGPAPDAAERVLGATLRAVAASAAAGSTASESAGAQAAPGALPLLTLPKLLAWLALAGASGAVGYELGYAAGGRERDAAHAASEPVVRTLAASAPERAPSAAIDAPAVAARAQEPETRDPASSAPERERPQGQGKAAAPPRAPAAGNGSSASTAEAAEPSALELEVRALRKVERALRAGDPRLALELLDALDRDVPEGELHEERAASRAMARCALDPAHAGELRAAFRDAHPQSVYRARVEQSCTAPKSQRAPTDSE